MVKKKKKFLSFKKVFLDLKGRNKDTPNKKNFKKTAIAVNQKNDRKIDLNQWNETFAQMTSKFGHRGQSLNTNLAYM